MGRKSIVQKWKEREVVDAIYLATSYYIVNAIEALMVDKRNGFDPFLKSHEKLMRDVESWQEGFCGKAALMIHDYMTLACYGELRHIAHHSNYRLENIDFTCKRKDKLRTKKDREEYTLKYGRRQWACIGSMNYTKESILKSCEYGFNNIEWEIGSFGGQAWGVIASHGLRYGKISDKIFCDAAFSLSHNSSPFLDKESTHIFKIGYRNEYKSFLDAQHAKAPIDLIMCLMRVYIQQKFYDADAMNLIVRALNILPIVDNNTKKLIINYDLAFKTSKTMEKISALDIVNNYEPIRFKKTEFKPEWMPLAAESKEEKKFIESLRVGMPVIIKNNWVENYKMDVSWLYSISNKEFKNSFHNMEIKDINYRTGKIIILDKVINNCKSINFRKIIVLDGVKTIKLKEKKGVKVA